MTQDAVMSVLNRNAFYKRLHYYALAVLAIAIMVIGVMICVLVYVSRNSGFPLYFATDSVGRLVNIVPVSQPNMSDDDVIAWTTEAVRAAYSFDYLNYRGQLQHSQRYFTPYGWNKYMDGLVGSSNLVALKENKLVQTAVVVNNPTILAKGRLSSGAFAWEIQLPLLVTYFKPPYDDSHKFSNSLMIKVIVQREPILQSYKGLGIAQFIGQVARVPIDIPSVPISTTPS